MRDGDPDPWRLPGGLKKRCVYDEMQRYLCRKAKQHTLPPVLNVNTRQCQPDAAAGESLAAVGRHGNRGPGFISLYHANFKPREIDYFKPYCLQTLVSASLA